MDALAGRSPLSEGRTRRLIHVGGLVQGVGFRPFIYRLAETWGLSGWVANEPAGVTIDIEGDAIAVAGFLADLPRTAPALSRIERLESTAMPPAGYLAFEIRQSRAAGAREALVSPDLATCPDCLAELFDPRDRRFRYPFINCTNCGPRYTIIDGLPYDRPLTAMRAFPMCPECAGEYHDPRDRRFHAQPDACPECGPRVWFAAPAGAATGAQAEVTDWQAIEAAAAALLCGGIIAIKGLGGFHLACDAAHEPAVARLRASKHRPKKPFAIMAPDIEAARAICHIDAGEATLLTSSRAPIVLLDRRIAGDQVGGLIAPGVAPGQLTLGVMLPYTPLQHLLLRLVNRPLVMTSGNSSEEPLVADNDEAARDLAPIAAAGLLLHNRDIPHRCDDSVARSVAGRQLVVRRARGYAPSPLPFSAPAADTEDGEIIALGGQEKAAFCVTKGERAFLSHHIGELTNPKAVDYFSESLAHYRGLFAPDVTAIACDFHPDYTSTRLAGELMRELATAGVSPRLINVQHHHAHIAAALGEYGLSGPVIGVAYDGTGLGDDGTLWGGEILIADRLGYRRFAHLAPFPLPGGDLAVARPYRTAYGLLAGDGGPSRDSRALQRVVAALPGREQAAMDFQLAEWINAPLSSSIGRLFDAAAVVCGFTGTCSYDAEAAIWLETLAGPCTHGDAAPYIGGFIDSARHISGQAILEAMAIDLDAGASPAMAARRFHATMAALTWDLCMLARSELGTSDICLGGGVFMNRRLLAELIALLLADGFSVYVPSEAPINDGGLAYGQAVVARARLSESGER